jgi:hypothetical protein
MLGWGDLTSLDVPHPAIGRPLHRFDMPHSSRYNVSCLLALAALLLWSSQASAQQTTLRYKADLNGDFLLIGNTLAHDCLTGLPAPVKGTVASCGVSTGDSSVDVYWTTDGVTATASTDITAVQARSQAMLQLPASSRVATRAVLGRHPRAARSPSTAGHHRRPLAHGLRGLLRTSPRT